MNLGKLKNTVEAPKDTGAHSISIMSLIHADDLGVTIDEAKNILHPQ